MFTPGAAARLDELLVALASLVANGDYDPVEEGSKAISARLYAAADARTVLHGSVCQRSRHAAIAGQLLHELRQSGFLPRHVAASCPPVESKSKDTRYRDLHEDDQLDEA
jgi:hypothetical protein